MGAILQSEWSKLRKSIIASLLIVGPLIGLITGINAPLELKVKEWEQVLLYMNLIYALLFLPLISGVFASSICRYEHQAGGWKQLLSLPVTRGKIFIAKYVVIILLVLVIQILYLCALLAVGIIRGFEDPFPLELIWLSIIGGWFATFPLIALQLWMSIVFNSFAVPFAINVMLTLPSILIINSERLGPYYLWAQPFMMMYSGGNTDAEFSVPWEQFIAVLGGGFFLLFIGGFLYFQRKSV